MQNTVAYKDLYFRLIACLVGAHIIVVYGETMSTFEILLYPGYYLSVLGSFIIAFILFSAIRWTYLKLDQKFDWRMRLPERIGLQVFFGFVIPGIAAFLLAFLYFKIRNGSNILKTSYLRYDFQFILALILAINIYYFAFYFYQRWLQAEQHLGVLRQNAHTTNGTSLKESIQISKGAKNMVLPVDEIVYIFREGETNLIRTINREDFFINQTLDEMQQQLPEQKFFRANRQTIIHRQAIKGFELLTYGKLEAQLEPPLKVDVVISQKTAPTFKKWLESN